MTNAIKTHDRLVVTKSNELIEASYRLTTNEQRIVLMLAARVGPEDEEFKRYRIEVGEFIEMLGLKRTGVHNDIQDIIKNLMKKTFGIKKQESVLYMPWLASAEYFIGQGYMELEFSPKLKPYFLQLKERFTTYRLHNVMQLRSVYSVRIYELLKQYKLIGSRMFELDNLKFILGIDKNEYEKYGHFKAKVLKVAQKELEGKTDIAFDFEEIKDGRKVAKLNFIIRNGPGQEEFPESEEVATDDFLTVKLKEFGLNDTQIHRIIHEHDETYILENLEAVEEEFKKGRVNNLPGYTITALEHDFRKRKPKIQNKLEVAEREKLQQEEAEAHDKQLIDSLYAEFEEIQRNNKLKIKETCTEKEWRQTLLELENSLNAVYKELYDRDRIEEEKSSSAHLLNEFLAKKFLSEEYYNFIVFAANRGYKITEVSGQYTLVK